MSQTKQEVSVSAYKALKAKYEKLELKTKAIRTDCRKLRKQVKRLEESRSNWKNKAVSRQIEHKALEKRFKRQQDSSCPHRHRYPTWLITLVVSLRIYCNCSYGSIKKILTLLHQDYISSPTDISSKYEKNLLRQIPCEKTLQNWVSKVGFYHMKHTDNQLYGKEVALIIDESVRVGSEKLFLALLLPIQKLNKGVLSFQDVQVFHLEGSESWTGEKIAKALKSKLETHHLDLKYVVCDEGNNLKRAIRLLEVEHLPDISHLMGTCLKKVFRDLEDYKTFRSCIQKCQARLCLCEQSYLRPPKQRTKASPDSYRDMNQEKTLIWAQTIFQKWNELNEIEQQKLSLLQLHRPLINQMSTCIDISSSIANLLKNRGLNLKTIEEALEILNIETEQITVKKFITFLKQYLMKYKHFILQPEWKNRTVYVCSDTIERLFGCYKAKLSDNYFVTTSSIALEIPLICLPKKVLFQSIQNAMENIEISQIVKWRKSQNTSNQAAMRAEFFKK